VTEPNAVAVQPLISALYPGTVVHTRLRPVRHRLRYQVVSALIDLDELPVLDRRFRLFGHNRFAPVSFHDADHGVGDGLPLRAWVYRTLEDAGLAADGPIRVLCYPRIWGYVFNPLSVFFCHRRDGSLAALIYEVHNTFGERHTYALAADAGNTATLEQTCAKAFYVSPFVPMDCIYRFRIRPPAERVSVAIAERDADGPLLSAVFTGKRRAIGDVALARLALGQPLMTLKIIAGIHWEALRLGLKGAPFFRHRTQRDAASVRVV